MPKSYGRYEALLDDPDVQVVHNATPNHLHYRVIVGGDRAEASTSCPTSRSR